MRSILSVVLASLVILTAACTESAPAATPIDGTPAAAAATPAGKCEHGVQPEICARCVPGLKPAFVAKNDWCDEHQRPESQCVICHPDLAKSGVK